METTKAKIPKPEIIFGPHRISEFGLFDSSCPRRTSNAPMTSSVIRMLSSSDVGVVELFLEIITGLLYLHLSLLSKILLNDASLNCRVNRTTPLEHGGVRPARQGEMALRTAPIPNKFEIKTTTSAS